MSATRKEIRLRIFSESSLLLQYLRAVGAPMDAKSASIRSNISSRGGLKHGNKSVQLGPYDKERPNHLQRTINISYRKSKKVQGKQVTHKESQQRR
jgi:hypothetical protein